MEDDGRNVIRNATPHFPLQRNGRPAPGDRTRHGTSTVLVADESEAFCTKLSALVCKIHGVSGVVQASRTQETWDGLSRTLPFAALVSVQLGDRGGGALLYQIKNTFPSTVLIALARYASPKLSAVYRECGADYCFDKNSELEAILRTIEQLAQQVQSNEPQKESP